jgi:hypothetical protein
MTSAWPPAQVWPFAHLAICPSVHLAGLSTPWSALLGASGHRAGTPHATARRAGLMAGERMAICPGLAIGPSGHLPICHLAGLSTPWSALLGAAGHRAGTPHTTARRAGLMAGERMTICPGLTLKS